MDEVFETASMRNPMMRRTLLAGGIGVLPADTMYGVSGRALSRETVERIYKMRKRDANKPMIVLISEWEHLARLGIRVTPAVRKKLSELWPGPVSVVLPCGSLRMKYLTRGAKTLAVRWPKLKPLTRLISEVGPLVSTSANLQGKPPAVDIDEAKKYFGHKVDFYVDWGRRGIVPSTLVKFEKGKMVVLRQGKFKLGGHNG